jgi:hypothetical protein
MLKLVWCISFFILLSGCSTNSALIKQGVEIDTNKGVILASVTHNGSGSGSYFYKKEGDKEPNKMEAVSSGFSGNSPDEYPDDLDRAGRLLAFEVDAGKYYLSDWSIFISFYGGYKIISPKEPVAAEFMVEPGKITYLGNLHTETLYGKNIFGITIAGSGMSIIENREDIDLEKLNKKYPMLSGWPMVIDIPKFKEVEGNQ